MATITRRLFWTVTLAGISVAFSCWCIMDYLLVRCVPYPDHVHDFDWMTFVFPVVYFLIALKTFRWHFACALEQIALPFVRDGHLSPHRNRHSARQNPNAVMKVPLASTGLVLFVASLLILFVGLPFHFAIGGAS